MFDDFGWSYVPTALERTSNLWGFRIEAAFQTKQNTGDRTAKSTWPYQAVAHLPSGAEMSSYHSITFLLGS
jgi:hypothetical protein